MFPLKGVDASKVEDKHFTRDRKSKSADRKLFSEGKPTAVNADLRKAAKTIDDGLTKNIKDAKNPMLIKYMAARFSLTKNDRPHAMKF